MTAWDWSGFFGYLVSPYLLLGAWATLWLTALSMILGLMLGFALALLRRSRRKWLSAPAAFYIWFFRGTPLLVQLIVIYTGLPQFGLKLGVVHSALVGLSLNEAAYLAEIIRSGLAAVPEGQIFAGRALGLREWPILRLVVMPQALRVILPPLGNSVNGLLKTTSITSVISMEELLRRTQELVQERFEVLELFAVASLYYLALTTAWSLVQNRIERRFGRADERHPDATWHLIPRHSMTETFRGTYTVMITPGDATRGLDLDAMSAFTDWQIAQGIHGLIPLGSTGEFLSLGEDERVAVAETVIRAAAGRVPVLVGTGAEDTREAVRLSRQAEALGADGVMVIPPFYSTPTDDELVRHYRTIGEAIGIPVMVYNNPATANVDLKPALVARIAECPNCRYIKESTLEVTRVRDILRLCGDRMTVFGGILGFESFVAGAEGWVAVASNVAPGPLARLFTLVADEGDVREARDLYLRWLPVIEAVGGQRYVAASKALLGHMGLDVGAPRPPRLPLPAAVDAEMAALVARFGLRFGGGA